MFKDFKKISAFLRLQALMMLLTIFAVSIKAQSFTGLKTVWNGFDRYDYLLDEATSTITPATEPALLVDGAITLPAVNGKRRCIIVTPKEAAVGKPWSWRGNYWEHQPQVEIELLNRGFHVVFVSPEPDRHWNTWYNFLTGTHGFSTKPVFIGMSRGGSNSFAWATANPDKVGLLYVDNPGIASSSLWALEGLVQNDVPILNVSGSIDPILRSALTIEDIYRDLGGRITMFIKEGYAHHPHSMRNPKYIADFIVDNLQPVIRETPSFATRNTSHGYFYDRTGDYTWYPSENTYIRRRGPGFSEVFDRYELRIENVRGGVSVIVPNHPAPGNPWVYRADFTNPSSDIDIEILKNGFHIVTGPVATDNDGPVLADWNTVYDYLVGRGLSRKVVVGGEGGAAGESYQWAIVNPEKVSCIFVVNPIMRSMLAEVQPLNNLAPLANAGIPVLHLVGEQDPAFSSQTQQAETRYNRLGGNFTIIAIPDEARFLAPLKDKRPIIAFLKKYN